MSNKQYRLKKDFIGFKHNIIPTGTLLFKEKIKSSLGEVLYGFEGYDVDVLTEEQIAKYPDWFEEIKQERIEVSCDGFFDNVGWGKTKYHFTVHNGERIPNDKFPLIKKAIEDVLNDTPPQEPEQKPVLFTTEDGKEIREMDEYWSINIGAGFPGVPYWTPIQRFGANTYPEGAMIKQFSTKEAAEEYVKNHKPMLSLREVMNVVHTVKDGAKGHDTKNYLNGELLQLAQSKLSK